MNTAGIGILAVLLLCAGVIGAQEQQVVRGTVFERDADGAVSPLTGVNVRWLGTTIGTATSADGSFSLPAGAGTRLLVSGVGFRPDTVVVTGGGPVRVFLTAEAREVGDVEVVGERSATVLDYMSPSRVQVMTQKELYKAACCNLSESFETNPSIDVAFTDAVTGTRQIEMLGLAGTYSQITLENLPAVRGLASNVGLTYIPGSWIESIQVSKGVGSVANGYESITGQINVELRKPTDEDDPRVFVNLFGSDDARLEGNLLLRERLPGTWTSLTMIHGALQQRPMDGNGDRFLDLPLSSTVNLLQRFHGLVDDAVEVQLSAGYVGEERKGGTLRGVRMNTAELAAEPAEYRFRLRGDQLRLSGKVGLLLSDEDVSSAGLQWSFTSFRQQGEFGARAYAGRQTSGYLNLIYDVQPGESAHGMRFGAGLMVELVREALSGTVLDRRESVPGVFAEYTYMPDEELAVVAGVRADRHNMSGGFVTPRIHLRYTPLADWVFRAVAGRGRRTATVLAENVAVLSSARAVLLPAGSYPFDPEDAWNLGGNLTHYFLLAGREATLALDAYRTEFLRQVVVNVDRDPREVVFQNLDGRSFSTSVQAEVNAEPVEHLDVRLAYRYLDVRQTVDGLLRERPLVARHRAFLNLGYASSDEGDDGRMVYDLTLQWFGGKRLPSTAANPEPFRREDRSPAFGLVNAQVTRSFTPVFDLYLGVENLLDFRQADPIIDPENPQGPFFDSSLVWAPVVGRMVYAGVRWKIEE